MNGSVARIFINSRREAVVLDDGSWRQDVERLIAKLEGEIPRAERRRRLPRWLPLAAAAGAVAVAGIVAAVLLLSGGGTGDVEPYVRQVDALLVQSSKTRGSLSALIGD